MSKHKIDATIPVGDPDLGAEIEARITFTYHARVAERGPSYASGGQPAEPAMAEWVSSTPLCNGKPFPYTGAFADLEQSSLDAIAFAWLESDHGQMLAMEQAGVDDEAAREYAAELRADR